MLKSYAMFSGVFVVLIKPKMLLSALSACNLFLCQGPLSQTLGATHHVINHALFPRINLEHLIQVRNDYKSHH